MKKRFKKLSFVLSLFMVLQLLLPAFNAFAAETAPTNLNVTVSNINDITLKWDKVFGVDNYNIYLLNGDERELFSKAYSNSWGKKGLAEGDYTVAVTYVKGSSESEISVPISFVIKFPDTQAPANLKAMVENVNDITLKWDAAGYTDSYNVFEVKNGERILIANTTSTSRSLPKLAQGNYVYEVTSVSNRFGESKAGSRTEVSIVFPEIQSPTGLTSTIRNENDLTLQWQPMEFANSYNVYEVKNGERTFVANTTTTSRLFSRLAEGEYHYEVTTVSDRFGESKLGSPISVTIVHPDILAPNLTATVTNHNDLALKWETVNYANSYNVYEVINGERKLIANTTGTSRNFSRLAEGEYLYEVTSVSNRFGESSDGSQVEVSIVYPEILVPANFFATVRNGNDLALTWQEAAYADKYYIYEVINGERKLVAETVNTSHFISDLAEGEYVYEIETESKRFGKSKNTSQVTASIVYPEMSAPVIELTMREWDSATISWEKIPFAEEYNIFEIVDGQPIFKVKAFSNGYGINGLSEGVHEFVVTSVNSSFGESNYSNKVMAEVVPEGLPDPDPNPELPAPVADEPEVNGDDVTLSWEPVKGAGSYNIYEEIDGEKVLVSTTTDTTITIPDLEPGDHEFIIVPVAESGVESDEFTTVTVETEEEDVTPPVTSSNVEDKWLKETFAVKLTPTDDLSGVEKTYYSLNGSEYVRGATVFVSDPGVHTVSFFSVDKAGNVEEVKTVEVKIDTTAPVTTANVTDQAVELTATDDLSGVVQTFYSINGSEFEEGTSFVVNKAGLNKVLFYSVDNAGNIEETLTIEVNTDTNAPETTSNVSHQWYQGEADVELTATDDLSGVAKTFYSVNGSEFVEGTSFVVIEPGTTEVSFYSVDNAGNVEDVKTAQVKIDTAAPETTSNVSEQWYQGEAAVELTATDDLSGVAKTFYSVNGSEFVEGKSFVVTEPGTTEVSFYSVDKAGNVEDVKTAQVKIDTAAPETTSNVSDQWYQGEAAVELTAKDDLSGVAKTFYSVNGTEFVEGKSFTVGETGVNEVSFYSIDNAGNVEETKTVKVKIDTNAPETTSNVSEQWNQAETKVELTATDDLSGVAKTFYSVNGSEFVEGKSFTVGETGVNEVSFYSIDNAGNVEETKTVKVKIDTNAPETTSNVSEQWYQGETKVELTATDDLSGVAKTFYSVNGSEFVEGKSFTVGETGVNEVSFYSIDSAGNVEETKTVKVKIDTNAPETTSNVSEQWYQGETKVELTATDDLSEVAKTFYSVNGSELKEGTSFVVSKEGVNSLTFYSVDKAGNAEAVKAVEVKIDKTAPTVSIPLESEHALGSTFTLDYVAADNLSGIAAETVTLNGKAHKKGDKITLDKPGSYKLIVTVTDAAGWTTQVEKEFLVYIQVTLEVLPRVIKGNKGVFTVKATLPKDYDSISFDVSTVTLNGVSADPKNNGLQKQAEKGHFKFEREDFVWKKGEVELELRGKLENGYLFIGKTTVEVK